MNHTENPRDLELQRKLRSFEAVWRRVSASRDPRKAAEAGGLKLMPGKCRRRGWR
ncbi:MAG: hypothetical protein IJQ42_05610 [Oscillospiraceae bacterium]|nr:hypothetical protein [Oscillospiraceae bacterium]